MKQPVPEKSRVRFFYDPTPESVKQGSTRKFMAYLKEHRSKNESRIHNRDQGIYEVGYPSGLLDQLQFAWFNLPLILRCIIVISVAFAIVFVLAAP